MYVGLGDCSQAFIDKFKATVMDDDRIIFEQGNIMNADVASSGIHPGSRLTSPIGNLSVGYRALRNGTPGLITAGHAISIGDNLTFGSSNIGTCTYSQFSGTIDAAFCETNAFVSNVTAYWETTLVPEVGVPIQGFPVTMEGFTTQMLGNGTILALHTTQTYKRTIDGVTYTLTDVCKTDYPADEGDSGGVVYDPYSLYIYGTHAGHYRENGAEEFSSFCLASNINQLLYLEMY